MISALSHSHTETMANENEPAKLLLPYLQRADELQKHEPLVAYYCRLYAMQRGLKIPTSDRTKTTKALLVSLMNQLEKDKKSLKLGPDDHLHLEGFASNVFAEADKQDRAGGADLNTAKTFYAASIFFEIRNQFGDFQPDLEQKQKYAAWKAADIRKALKEGRKPIPGPADGDKDLSILSSTSSGEYDLELSRSDPAIKPALEPDQLHQSYDEIPPSPSNNSPSLPSYPTTSYPSHDFHPPPSTNRSENSTYSQPYHHQPYPREPQQHFPQNYPSHEISSPSYTNFQSYPSFTETSLPDAPSNHHSYHQGSDATYSTLSASTTTNYPSTTHYNSSSRNGTGLEAAPNSVEMYEYDSNYQPPPEKIAEAHKAARFAVGALAFDDISVTVDHLKKSLELLTNPSASQHKGDESGRRRKRGDDLDESLSRRMERRRRRGEAKEVRQGEARQGDGEATGAARDEQTQSARDEQTKSARDEERVTRIDMSTSSNNDAGFFQNKRCKCGKKIVVYISESEKNSGKLYFKCANKACDYFAWGVAPTGNGSNIQKSGYDYDFARNNEVVNILEQLEANQRERLEAIKFMMLTTIVMVGFTILVVLLK
ncbi:hypothetical protein LOK49_LG06G00429 [Camellia lanceoleosa]|uniref:Uncharacterized protein n=1 Tax=Camellia lanceoleosa TaxID=1840588 RepID=A0ACC0HF58_9ERIC|nr:hypothetical protein LOK49_LG06G00429 [Camellia lanceoleosa]